jgi:hypothetical protein
MIRSKRLDDDGVANLKPKAKRQTLPDPELRGHYIRVTPNGSKSFWVVARDPNGKQVWRMVGTPPMLIADAREKALGMLRGIRSTVLLEAEESPTFDGVAASWFERQMVKKELRSERTIRGLLKQHLKPAFAGMLFTDLKRKHVSVMLDHVEDSSGARTADYCLSILSSICKWYTTRDDDYVSPIVPGMSRREKGSRSRSRILTDDELRALWAVNGLFGNFTKFALLTAQRKDKLMTMRFADVVDGVWNIPLEKRAKGTGESLRLPKLALDIIEQQRLTNGASPFVFAEATGSPRSKLGRLKKAFEAANPDWPQWQLHDLRRTVRSLMASVGVPERHAEEVMGHKQGGVLGTYDRHRYLDEKGRALDVLAGKLRDIVAPVPGNLRRLREAG